MQIDKGYIIARVTKELLKAGITGSSVTGCTVQQGTCYHV